MTAIVIPAADVVPDADKLLQACLYSIEQQNPEQWEKILVCFDACKAEFINYFRKQFPFIEAVVNSGNRLNFAGNVNRGIRAAYSSGCLGVLCVNQDCVLPGNAHLITGAGIAVATPVTVCKEPPIDSVDLKALAEAQPFEYTRTQHKKLTGFCIYLSRSLIDKIGIFDERTFQAGFDDDDICARAILAGFPVEHINVAVQHYGSRCGAYNMDKLFLAMIKFRTKWQIPPAVQHGEFNEWIAANHVWSEAMVER